MDEAIIEILEAQLLGWLVFLCLGALGVLCFSSEQSERLKDLKKTLGLSKIHNGVVFGILGLWAILCLVLFGGLLSFIWRLIDGVNPDEFTTLIAKTAALTAVLGATIALPFTAIRLRLTTEQNAHNDLVLFNEKLARASADLHARRETDDNSGFEDDIIRRTMAIDELFALAEERPETAPRVARILSVYLKEMTKLHKAVAEESDWEDAIAKRSRSDMQAAAQSMGRLKTINGLTRATRSKVLIDLDHVNLQGMQLSGLDFSKSSMHCADLQFAQLAGTCLERATLTHAKLCRANCDNVNLTSAHLQNAICIRTKLTQGDLTGTKLNRAVLHRADLSFAELNHTFLVGANLAFAELTGTRLRDVNLERSSLEGADLYESAIERTSLRRATLRNTKLDSVVFASCSLDETNDLSGSASNEAALRDCDLTMMRPPYDLIEFGFGDGSVSLPADLTDAIRAKVEEKWPSMVLDEDAFWDEYNTWARAPNAYVPPQLRND